MSGSRKLCKGCATYKNKIKNNKKYHVICLTDPITTIKGIKKICPCVKCLVKMVCSSDCEDYSKYYAFTVDPIIIKIENCKGQVLKV